MKAKIVAFCGSKGSGKSTSATVFKALVGADTVEEVAIAGHLKTACAEAFDVDYDSFIDPAKKEVELETYVIAGRKNLETLLKLFKVEDFTYDQHVRPHLGRIFKTPRQLLQYIGTEVLHPLDPLIHVKYAMKARDPSKTTLLTDLRFVAEFNFFAENPDFLPVYVKNSKAEIAASVDAHPSERQYENFKGRCYLLNNEYDMLQLDAQIRKLIQVLDGQAE